MQIAGQRHGTVMVLFSLTAILLFPAKAAVLQKISLDEMVPASDNVVVGTCEKTETVWLGSSIYTDTRTEFC